MAIYKYENTSDYTSDKPLVETYTHGMSTRSLLSALGDFWYDYFTDTDLLNATISGVVTLYATEYYQILNLVLGSSIFDIPVEEPIKYDLLVFDNSNATVSFDAQGEPEYIAYPAPNTEDIEYLTSSLFSPSVVLEHGVHYTVVDEEIRFVVDIFNDPDIIGGAYNIDSSDTTYILFWAMNSVLTSKSIYNRFGTYTYREEPNSDAYKVTVLALQYFYAKAKSPANIQKIINVLYGAPYTQDSGEQVLDISPNYNEYGDIYYSVTTSKRTYVLPPLSTIPDEIQVGAVLPRMTLLAYWHTVDDYITNEDWYEGARFPDVIEEVTHPDFDPNSRARKDGNAWEQYLYRLYDSVLKYNIVRFQTNLNFENIKYFQGAIQNLYQVIRDGFPPYLYPLIEAIFNVSFTESVEEPKEHTGYMVLRCRFSDDIEALADTAKYDGTYTYSDPSGRLRKSSPLIHENFSLTAHAAPKDTSDLTVEEVSDVRMNQGNDALPNEDEIGLSTVAEGLGVVLKTRPPRDLHLPTLAAQLIQLQKWVGEPVTTQTTFDSIALKLMHLNTINFATEAPISGDTLSAKLLFLETYMSYLNN